MALFKNASPEVILLGADDKGGAAPLPSMDSRPQHVPLIFTFAQKGPVEKQYVAGASAIQMFGSETFKTDSPYFNHATFMGTMMMGAGNACVIKRVLPPDVGVKSNIVVYADVLKTNVPNYVRNSLGNYVIDPDTNEYKVDSDKPEIPGVKIKFITEYVDSGINDIGSKTPKQGTMSTTDADGNTVTSTMYPILELSAASYGKYYNNIGFAIESLKGEDVDPAFITTNKALPYKLSIMTRLEKGGTPQVLRTLFGEPSVLCGLKPGTINPVTKVTADLGSIIDSNWYNEKDPLKPLRYNDFEKVHIYNNYIQYVLSMIMENEKSHISTTPTTWDDGQSAATISWFDFTTDDQEALNDELYLINLFTGKSTKGINYFTLLLDDSTPAVTGNQKEVHITKDTPIFMDGGSDGTLSDANFEAAVRVELAKYTDPNSDVIDDAVNVETHLYDSGFSIDLKLELFNFISVRKNTAIIVGTHEVSRGDKVLPLSDTRAIAVMLKTRAKLFPESVFFGTPVSRAVIAGGAYRMYDGIKDVFYPLTFEIAYKTARMMGGPKWKSQYVFDHGPNAELKLGYDYEPGFIPAGIKPLLWNSGLVWAQPKDRATYFIPAIQTVYDDDTSPMNNWYTQCALVSLNRIAADTWREFTGTSTMGTNTFKEAVLNYVNKRLDGLFDGLLVVIPEVIITDEDKALGYSWRLKFKLYSPTMKTKMVAMTEVYRMDALGQ